MESPDREHVRGVAAADHHDVLLRDQRRDVLGDAIEEREMRRFAIGAGELLIEGQQVVRAVARSGRQEEDARPLAPRESQDVARERWEEELPAAARDDAPRHGLHPGADAIDDLFERVAGAVEHRRRAHALVRSEPFEHRGAPGEPTAEGGEQHLVAAT